MCRPNVVIEQPHVATGHLKGRGAVAEDPLQGEHVAAVREKRPGKAMPQDVGEQRSAMACRPGQSSNQLLDCSSGERHAAAPDKERGIRSDPASGRQPGSDCSPTTTADRDDALARTLAADSAAAFGQIHVADRQSEQLTQPQARVEE